jgi:hypothetical protein
MRYALIGRAIAVVVFVLSGGRLLFAPLLILLPLAGLAGQRRRRY